MRTVTIRGLLDALRDGFPLFLRFCRGVRLQSHYTTTRLAKFSFSIRQTSTRFSFASLRLCEKQVFHGGGKQKSPEQSQGFKGHIKRGLLFRLRSRPKTLTDARDS
ncbi:MAG: hypothetical protein H7Y30_08810 [Pyrinomonadaceae bacterium]|nr:hypothetical protein [Pyrinomonadaceae bacterium]